MCQNAVILSSPEVQVGAEGAIRGNTTTRKAEAMGAITPMVIPLETMRMMVGRRATTEMTKIMMARMKVKMTPRTVII